jgi:hypothetical protein
MVYLTPGQNIICLNFFNVLAHFSSHQFRQIFIVHNTLDLSAAPAKHIFCPTFYTKTLDMEIISMEPINEQVVKF